IVLSARSETSLKKVAESLPYPDKTMVLPLDLEDSGMFDELANKVFAAFGRIDILVNNGGISQRGTVAETGLEVDRKIMEINYFGNIALAKAVLPYFRKQNYGQIIVISSIAGKFGFYLRSAYAASKHALQGFYESLLLEEAKYNVFVTIAYPGKINTPISMSAITATGDKHGVMDHNQATGMSAEKCVKIISHAAQKHKKSIVVGGKETYAVYIKRFFPTLFWKIIKNQKAT
ncbi:MAG: SDR family NAD(P)-dependent oxidoreductase, partial [Putridiphycobacter sp.]|nr:SDR family NAD(P)-dependent oxidoreductase [Putridiphycobacter sp.]